VASPETSDDLIYNYYLYINRNSFLYDIFA